MPKPAGTKFVTVTEAGAGRLRVRHPLLPREFHQTFNTPAEANDYGDKLLATLRRGIVPELHGAKSGAPVAGLKLSALLLSYRRAAPIAPTEHAAIDTLLALPLVANTSVADVTNKWAEQFASHLKVERHLAPSTVRKRVESLARALDWHLRRTTANGEPTPPNPLRSLPHGYSVASADEAAKLAKKGVALKRDAHRDRRLEPEEAIAIESSLAGARRPGRERPLSVDPAFTLLYHVIVDHGLRLFEAYRMQIEDIDFAHATLRVRGSKGHRGVIKWRSVPLKQPVLVELRKFVAGRKAGLVFPWWDGAEETRQRVSNMLSQRFASLFEYAGAPDLTEHDLRHEATCRWMTLQNSRGEWALTETALCKIMGWSGANALQMLLRYASLRGSDLAAMIRA
jgi:integrase